MIHFFTNLKHRKSKRSIYIITTIILLIIEVIIALFIHDDFIRPYMGDVLVVITIYCFIRIWFPNKIRFLHLYVFFFAAGVEVLQYFELVKRLHLEDNVFLKTLIGSVFDIKDIFCYGLGCLLVEVLYIVQHIKKSICR